MLLKKLCSGCICILAAFSVLTMQGTADEAEPDETGYSGYIEYTTTFPENATNGHYFYYKLFDLGDYKLRDGDFLDYEVWISEPTAGFGGLDIISADPEGGTLRDDPGSLDQNFLSGHPSTDLSPVAHDQWYHRRVQISSYLINKTGGWVVVASDMPKGVTKLAGKTVTVRYRNIKITNMKKETTCSIFEDGQYTAAEDMGIMDDLKGIAGSVSDVKIMEGTVSQAPASSETSSSDDKGGIPPLVWVIAASVVVVIGIPAILILVYFIKQKKKETSS